MLRFRIVPVTHFQQNCSVVWCDETLEAAVVDPGGDIDKILAAIREEGVTLKAIWLTHGHLDHVGGTAEMAASLNLPIIGPHREDQFWIQGLAQQATMMGFQPVPTFQPGRWLQDGDELTLGRLRFQVLHCPGHTPGHVVLFESTSRMAWVGDVLFQGSVGRTDFPRGDSQQLVASIRQKLWPLGDDVQFIPGHGPMSTFGHERQTNPFVADTRFG
ncbi:MBL fold metallo-hydrolase [Marinibactrum halimedae]|uniref:Metallo-beta-lactamase domain-containing protein n=1 Tax=Marinibactrum halimedae TaxID=1444977 RepID=A0AA37T211_9GAMM|nr:MBL fold metallo-hydrolase [Marinibactrum halimedae]MCD9457808.1 MBL fold metallo-hydrolase [Marinibactrum halimedae]GLS24818.1 hypothetical protein GCM10007877_05320 [Marinibactrum halimedae]